MSRNKVVKLADFVSTPICARTLANIGVEVIRIECELGHAWSTIGIASCHWRINQHANPGYDINK